MNKLHCDFCSHCKVGYNLHNSTMYILLKAKFMALINIFSLPTAFLFGRICFVVLIMRKGRESSSSGPWHLGCTMEVFHGPGPVHTARWAKCVFCVSPRFVFCVFICVSLICLWVPILLCFPGQLSHLPYSFWR